MTQIATLNRRILQNARPRGAPTAQDFRLESGQVPKSAAGQVLLRTLDLSVDPYMRGRMSDGPLYAAPVAIGDVMVGGTVSRVEVSMHDDFHVGGPVPGYTGWQDYALSEGQGLTSLYPGRPAPLARAGRAGRPLRAIAKMGRSKGITTSPSVRYALAAGCARICSAVWVVAHRIFRLNRLQ